MYKNRLVQTSIFTVPPRARFKRTQRNGRSVSIHKVFMKILYTCFLYIHKLCSYFIQICILCRCSLCARAWRTEILHKCAMQHSAAARRAASFLRASTFRFVSFCPISCGRMRPRAYALAFKKKNIKETFNFPNNCAIAQRCAVPCRGAAIIKLTRAALVCFTLP